MSARRLRFGVLIACLIGAQAVLLYAISATDPFSVDGAGAGPNWTAQTTGATLSRSSGQLNGSGTAAFACAYRSGEGAYGSNHSSQLTVVTVTNDTNYVMLSVNNSTDTGDTSYDNYTLHTDGTGGSGQFSLLEIVNGSGSEIAHYSETVSTGNTVKLERSGNNLKVYLNGGEITCDGGSSCAAGVVTDTTLAANQYPGVCMFQNAIADDWVGTDEGIGGAVGGRLSLLGVGR